MDHRIEREGEGEECEGTEDNMEESFYLSSDYLRPHSRGSYEKQLISTTDTDTTECEKLQSSSPMVKFNLF